MLFELLNCYEFMPRHSQAETFWMTAIRSCPVAEQRCFGPRLRHDRLVEITSTHINTKILPVTSESIRWFAQPETSNPRRYTDQSERASWKEPVPASRPKESESHTQPKRWCKLPQSNLSGRNDHWVGGGTHLLLSKKWLNTKSQHSSISVGWIPKVSRHIEPRSKIHINTVMSQNRTTPKIMSSASKTKRHKRYVFLP